MGTLVTLLIVLVVLGLVLYLVNSYLPVDVRIKQIINVVAIVAAIIWILQTFL